MEKIILISGKSHNGKSEVAKIFKQLLEQQGKKVLILPFAKYLKQYLHDYFGWDGINKDEVYRSNAQYIGTEIIRKKLKKPLFHAMRICDDIEILGDKADYFLIDDCRFLNELTYTMARFPHKTISIRVSRVNYNSPLTEEQQNHPSETDLDDYKGFDYYIYSKNSIENLEFETKRVFNKIMNDIGKE